MMCGTNWTIDLLMKCSGNNEVFMGLLYIPTYIHETVLHNRNSRNGRNSSYRLLEIQTKKEV
jgi:hypothetical protein